MARDPLGLVGQLIDGQYRLEKPIGEGGFSVVYRATHLGMNEPVAVKCLKLQSSLDAETSETFARRFRDEGRLLYRLSQGNLDIVRCLTSSTTTSPTTGGMVPYMVLEWLEGQSLMAELRERRKQKLHGRSLEEVLALLEPAALALDCAHKQGVVHRDVKPANLFLARSRAGVTRIKVLDFGLAKILDETIGITLAATRGNFMVCSPRYAAPEQFNTNIGAIGPWTDVYALALVVLEALRDERVRKAEGMAACLLEACDPAVRISASALGILVPPGVDRVLAQAATTDVTVRHKSAGEFWTELTRAAREAVVPPPPPSRGDWSRTVIDPPRSGPIPGAPLGLGGTVIMGHLPGAPTPKPGGLARTVPLGYQAPQPSRSPAPAYTPAPPPYAPAPPPYAPPAPAPTPRPPVVSSPAFAPVPRVVSSSPMVASVPRSAPSVPSVSSGVPSSSRARRSGTRIAIVILILIAALAAGGVVGWRVWRAHRAMRAMVTSP